MNERPTPETAAETLRTGVTYRSKLVSAEFAENLERQRDEARHKLEICMAANSDVQRIADEREALRDALRKCHNEYIEVSHDREAQVEMIRSCIQMIRDEAFGLSPEETVMQNIAAIEKGIADLRKGYWALRDALRVRIESECCPDCFKPMTAGRWPTCRHYATEREVMQ